MNSQLTYESLQQHYFTGNLRDFRNLYSSIGQENKSEQARQLAIKVFKETNEWDLLFDEIGYLKESQKPEHAIKGKLYEALFIFSLKVQSRKAGAAAIAQCWQVSRDFRGSELDFFAQRISLSVQMGLTTLGLADAAKKKQIIEAGIGCLEGYFNINIDEALILLEALTGQCMRRPMPDPALALQILEKFGKLPNQDSLPTVSDAPFYLRFAEAKLLLEHFDRAHLPTPAELPASLILVKDKLLQTSYLPGEFFLMGLYGSHLLKLECLEGAGFLEQTLQPLWDLGYEQAANNNKEKIITWIEQRGFIKEAEQFNEKYQYISNPRPADFEQNLEKLQLAHQFFSEGAYAAGLQFMKASSLGQESETFRFSFANMWVNSAAKLQSERQSLMDFLDEQIRDLEEVQNSLLLAQLYTLKTRLEPNPHSDSYKLAIQLYDRLGYTDDAVNHLSNQAYDLALSRKAKEVQPLINEEVIQAFNQVYDYLKKDELIPNRVSLEAALFQRWGTVLIFSKMTDEAAVCFNRAGELYLAANDPFNYAINTHYLAGAHIQIGRNMKKLEHYDFAMQHLAHGIEILENNRGIDFSWRLNFQMALALSEPLKCGLEGDPEKHQERFEKADRFYNKALEVFALILKRNSLSDKSQKLLAFGQLNQEIRQLIYSGFYCYFLQRDWEKCVFWLEKVRAKTLLADIASSISPDKNSANHVLILEEALLNSKLLKANIIIEQREIHAALEELYLKMHQKKALADYAAKKQGSYPNFHEVKEGLMKEAALAGRDIVFIYYYTHENQIYAFGIRSDSESVLFEQIEGISVPELENSLAYSYQLYIKSYHKLKPNEHFWLKYSPLITPIGKWTKAGEVLCLVPYGFLHDLPFHALLLNGQHLIERNPIFYNASLSSWEYLRNKTAATALLERPAVFSNPEEELNLELSLKEAEAIGSILKVPTTTGEKVIKSRFLAALSECTLLHFAGHGFYDSGKGLESGLALYGSETVSVHEIMNQSTNADLVVLSACDTGLHRNHPGEERAGLVTAFISAGAKSVIASQWRVTDTDAQRFFSLFYPKLKTGMPKVVAMQETMIELMKDCERQQFYHWGAFGLYGYW